MLNFQSLEGFQKFVLTGNRTPYNFPQSQKDSAQLYFSNVWNLAKYNLLYSRFTTIWVILIYKDG